ncbi:CzcE family metal-binding protein [uncultured Massilia sp.]|uniref:CzcE family metal-binding protein n=1 Tax=uncultured Massilia sp. TaxID=169973 RepID=UPI0025CC7111|nr:CzcE family metal-binding protein [uncultured Massilia sp.]
MKAATTLAAVAILSLSCAAAGAAPLRADAAGWGMPAADAAAGRTVVLRDGARYLNVSDGETVRVVHDGRSFTWTFSAPGRDGVVALDRVAPQGFDTMPVRVYVAPNPLYTNG